MPNSNGISPTEELWPTEILSQPFGSFSRVLELWAQVKPDQVALKDHHMEVNWKQLDQITSRLAAQMRHTGLKRGQAVAILGSSTVRYALVFLAAVKAGGCAATLTTSASREQLERMAEDSGAIHLFIEGVKQRELGPDFASGMLHIPLEEIESWMVASNGIVPSDGAKSDDPFNIIYSSGTTGTPKGIVQSHAMRWTQYSDTALQFLGSGLPLRSITSTPLYSNTTMIAFLAPLLAGGSVRITEKFDCATWLSAVEQDQATITMLVPIQYQRLMGFEGFERFDCSSLALKFCTSAPFSKDLKKRVLGRMPGALIEIYSMTEGGVVCLLPCHEFPDKLHTVGRPSPGSEIKVLNDADKEVTVGVTGNLVGRSAAVMTEYKNQPEKTSEAFWTDPNTGNRWMRMGDLGRLDEEGFVELSGRSKDLIISGGFNVYPSDLEAELEKEEDVLEAAVIGAASAKWGETPVGFVVLQSKDSDCQDLLSRVNSRVGKIQRLAALYSVPRLPRSHIGKLLKSHLREKLETID
ncbi:MAG: class I adenylate-forming enzyme family protein [Pseudomonadota bacterium]